jgi:hypothetical protein
MATNADTQAFLDESKTPSIQTLGQAKTAVLAYRPEAGKTKRQFGIYRDLLSGAVIAEDDAALRAKLEEMRAAAIGVETAFDQMREMFEEAMLQGRLFNERDAEARAIATALGYTV